jgi:hypothetical protein
MKPRLAPRGRVSARAALPPLWQARAGVGGAALGRRGALPLRRHQATGPRRARHCFPWRARPVLATEAVRLSARVRRAQSTVRLLLFDDLPGGAGRRFLGAADFPSATAEIQARAPACGRRARRCGRAVVALPVRSGGQTCGLVVKRAALVKRGQDEWLDLYPRCYEEKSDEGSRAVRPRHPAHRARY